jgi:tRNA-splicing ligase RtcB
MESHKDIADVIRVVVGAGLSRPVAKLTPMGVMKG